MNPFGRFGRRHAPVAVGLALAVLAHSEWAGAQEPETQSTEAPPQPEPAAAPAREAAKPEEGAGKPAAKRDGAPVAGAAAAGAAAAEEPPFAERTMSSYTFLYPTTFDPAFVTTHFGVGVGLAYLSIPNMPVDNEHYDLQLGGVRESFDLGIRFHERIGIYGEIGGSAFSGVNVESAILQGATAALDWQAGAAGMIVRIDRTATQIGARAKVVGDTGRSVQPLFLLEALASNPESSVNKIIKGQVGKLILAESSSIGGGGSVNAAQAIGRFVGAQLSLEMTYKALTESVYSSRANALVDVSGNETDFGLGVAVGDRGSTVPRWFPHRGKQASFCHSTTLPAHACHATP